MTCRDDPGASACIGWIRHVTGTTLSDVRDAFHRLQSQAPVGACGGDALAGYDLYVQDISADEGLPAAQRASLLSRLRKAAERSCPAPATGYALARLRTEVESEERHRRELTAAAAEHCGIGVQAAYVLVAAWRAEAQAGAVKPGAQTATPCPCSGTVEDASLAWALARLHAHQEAPGGTATAGPPVPRMTLHAPCEGDVVSWAAPAVFDRKDGGTAIVLAVEPVDRMSPTVGLTLVVRQVDDGRELRIRASWVLSVNA